MKQVHILKEFHVFRVGDSGPLVESLPVDDAERRARAHVSSTRVGGWPVVLQTWEHFRECVKARGHDQCYFCDVLHSPIREVGRALCVSGTGVPVSVLVAQQLFEGPQ